MKIVFLGTPEFAVPSLEILINSGYDVVGVVTAPGKQAGRGLKIKEPAIKEAADKAGIKTLQPVKLTDPQFISELKNLNADLFIVVAFRMLPESVWQMPAAGTFNLHSSLLPQYRGAAPINRVIMNGETKTGVTTFFLKHEIDTGNILFRKDTEIAPDETAGELHDRLKIMGAELVLHTVKEIEKGNIIQHHQNEFMSAGELLKAAPKIFTADCAINWHGSSNQIHNQVRGLSPFPGAFTKFIDASGNNMLLKIYRTHMTEIPCQVEGEIIVRDKMLLVGCGDFYLQITELQQEGKKRISASDYIKGFRTEKNWRWAGLN